MADYEEAYRSAPIEVKKLIKQYEDLPEEEKKDTPLLYFILNNGTPPYKMSKEDSKYTDESQYSENCANCEFLYYSVSSKNFICSQIRGEVKPEGWCNQWAEQENKE